MDYLETLNTDELIEHAQHLQEMILIYRESFAEYRRDVEGSRQDVSQDILD